MKNPINYQPKQKKQLRGSVRAIAGFTIVELMIAATVFSMVLLLITFGVIRFNQAYYGGIIQSNTQNVARTAIENISQAIQFDGGTVVTSSNGSWKGICVGSRFYQYQPGMQLENGGPLGPDQRTQALIFEPNAASCNSPGTSVSGTELLGKNMRIAVLSVAPISGTGLYKIDARVVYGDDDLLCSPNEVNGSCTSTGTMPPGSGNYATPDLQCKSLSGPFCAVSELSTVVGKRVD
jgi:type II secretory pathway pseudopilin PulG